jgi:hypothetical protein
MKAAQGWITRIRRSVCTGAAYGTGLCCCCGDDSGTIKHVTLDLHPATLEGEQSLHEHAAIQAVGTGAAG